jgi:hypothetical protein
VICQRETPKLSVRPIIAGATVAYLVDDVQYQVQIQNFDVNDAKRPSDGSSDVAASNHICSEIYHAKD